MSIAAGHFDDPKEILGLAHLLEHVLFLGSEQFPEANGFQSFLASHGGRINAWTGTEYANFHFEVDDSFPEQDKMIIDQFLNKYNANNKKDTSKKKCL